MPEISQTLLIHASSRRVRRIVTVSGRGVRGTFPSRKSAKSAQFESRIEEKTLRILEVAPLVESIETQPQVFEYSDGTYRRRYTPDVKIETGVGTVFLEVKDDESLTSNSQAIARLSAAARYLRQRGHRFHIVLLSDLDNDLQHQLELLLKARPIRRRYRPNIDATLWDPENGTHLPAELQQQWEDAKRECDAFLHRIMKRDPDDLLPVSIR
ncbi:MULTISPECIES: Tn7 transposase TnsA N-terminal domain-containing protein [unclassified Burkholderia]|uniref:Tn7 transposase TnsA N-terminal domain-containing protein n=1 Tax=unclassified Burkholderia TaxID=2613784 RepID=UPI0021AB917B|nr:MULTISPECIES: Tn7 transposase TnsA N-terminal domain-containing protein [unclassified Burkholderia]